MNMTTATVSLITASVVTRSSLERGERDMDVNYRLFDLTIGRRIGELSSVLMDLDTALCPS